MAAKQTHSLNVLNESSKNSIESISDIFLCYLQEILDDQMLKQFYEDKQFVSIKKFLPKYGIAAFPSLVDLSLKYQSNSIQSVLAQFNVYYQNY